MLYRGEVMEYLTQLKMKYDKLMVGRYGLDKLSGDLFVLWLVIGFVNSLIRSRIVTLVALILPILAVARMLSQNTVKRSNENRKYLKLRNKVIEFFKLQYRKIKERKTHRYYKCKNCSASLRVKRKKGEHTVVCPKCGKEFKVKIR